MFFGSLIASAVARRTRATAVSTTWSVCGRLPEGRCLKGFVIWPMADGLMEDKSLSSACRRRPELRYFEDLDAQLLA